MEHSILGDKFAADVGACVDDDFKKLSLPNVGQIALKDVVGLVQFKRTHAPTPEHRAMMIAMRFSWRFIGN